MFELPVEVEVWNRCDPKDDEHGQRHRRDKDREAKGRFDAGHVEPDEGRIGREPPQRLGALGSTKDRAQVPADADYDHCRGQDVLHVLGEAGDVRAPGAHCGAGKRVRSARVRKGGGHFGDAEAEAGVHDRDDQGGDQKPAEASGGQTEVPAKEVPRNHGPDAERPE